MLPFNVRGSISDTMMKSRSDLCKKRVLPAGERPVGVHGRKKTLVRGARDDGLQLYLGGRL